MAYLYKLSLLYPVKGFGKPSVRSSPTAGLAGHLNPETGALVGPSLEDVREALPHYWRRAFDRHRHVWFQDAPDDKVATIRLYGSRGQVLNVVLAVPYVFSPKAPPLPAGIEEDAR